jgi:hypothetical protein
LEIRVQDESGQPIWARLKVHGEWGDIYHPAQAVTDHTGGTFVIQGSCELQLPPRHYHILGDHGLEYAVDPTNHSWVAARCFLRSGRTIQLAHTSPVYLKGHWDCRLDAQYFINWMNDLINQTKIDPQRFFLQTQMGQEQQNQLLRIYSQTLTFYDQKFHQNCSAN